MKLISHYLIRQTRLYPNEPKEGIFLVLRSISHFLHSNITGTPVLLFQENMKHAKVEDTIASFPHPILPTVQEDPDYHTNTILKLLQANERTIDTHLGGETLGHLGIIVSVAAYIIVAPETPWANPAPPGTAAQISAAGHLWE
jgi:hypothetical protein